MTTHTGFLGIISLLIDSSLKKMIHRLRKVYAFVEIFLKDISQ